MFRASQSVTLCGAEGKQPLSVDPRKQPEADARNADLAIVMATHITALHGRET